MGRLYRIPINNKPNLWLARWDPRTSALPGSQMCGMLFRRSSRYESERRKWSALRVSTLEQFVAWAVPRGVRANRGLRVT
jgi:hypothetical protein